MDNNDDDALSGWLRAGGDAPTLPGKDLPPASTQFGAEGGALPRAFGRGRLVALLTLTAVIWVIAAALLAATDHGTRADGAAPPRNHAKGVPDSSPTEAPAVPPLEAAACAEIAVHEAVTREDGGRWVDAAAVQRLEPTPVPVTLAPSERAVLAVVRALVLEGDGRIWTRRMPARYAVPLALDQHRCRELAAPWPLPAGERPVAEVTRGADGGSTPDGRPTPDGSATPDGYADALTTAGYREVDVRDVAKPAGGVVVVDAEAVPPSGTAREVIRVWMHPRPEPRLVGT